MGKAKILIVEDDPIIVEDIEGILRSHDMEISGSLSNAEDVLHYATLTKPDLVLMDIRLEGEMDGIEAAKLLWLELNIPCIYLTAHSNDEIVQRAKQSYPCAYLLKPFTERELCITIDIALNQRVLPPLLEVPGSLSYYLLRKLLVNPDFKAQKQFFFKADPARELTLASALGDLTADVLDILCSLWLQGSETPVYIWVSADDFLRLRGLQEQKSGTGRRGGYEVKWRNQIAQQIELLSQSWSLGKKGQSSPILEVKPGSKDFLWLLKPGKDLARELYSANAKTALLSLKVLQYNPHRQNLEKRLARFLSYQWRTQLSAPYDSFSVQQILDELEVQIDTKHPLRTKERLERVLGNLMQDLIIEKWHYQTHTMIQTDKKQWLQTWLDQIIQIEKPRNIREEYAGLNKHSTQPKTSGQMSMAFIRQMRQEKGLSLMEVAAEIGITHARLSQIERGNIPGPQTKEKLKTWVLKQFIS